MQLKALELLGFKSFPERTVLRFDAGITAVVGPNGSGKSNIADAMRWVMGEQSTRALRGGKMEDVIFGGSPSRPRLGFAEVSLTLDNSEGQLPIEGSEVSLTRRYYRSGDSEYYINRRLCRLKDLNELLMDTGLGQDGYALIGQGKIDEILSVKSTQRRDIFEEAAGISRYRNRKEEAEKKLANTRENLLRIQDKLEEIVLQLEPLRRQAEQANTYFRLQEQLRLLEVSLWMAQLQTLREKHKLLREEDQQAQALLVEARQTSEQLYGQAEALQDQAQAQEITLERARGQLATVEESIGEVAGRRSVLVTKQAALGENLRRLETQGQSNRAMAEELAESLSQRQAELAELDRQSRQGRGQMQALDLRLEALDREMEAAREALSRQEARARQEEQATLRILHHLAGVEATEEALRGQKALGDAALEESALALEALAKARLAHGARRLELEAELAEHGARLQALERGKVAAVLVENDAREAWMSLRMEENTCAARLRLLTDMERQYEGYSKAVKTVMERGRGGKLSGVHGPVAELISVSETYAVAVETALGSALQNLVVEDQACGKAVLEDLKRLDGGRVTCLPLDAVKGQRLSITEPGYLGLAVEKVDYDPRYEGVLNQLLGKVLLAADLNAAIAMAKKYYYRHRIVTMDGQLLSPGGAMTGGSGQRKGGVLSRAAELAALRAGQGELTARCREGEASVKTAQEQRLEWEASVDSEIRQGSALREILGRHMAEGQALEGKEAEARERWQRLHGDALALHQRLEAGEDGKKQAQERLQQLAQRRESIADARSTAEAVYARLQGQRESTLQLRRQEDTSLAVCVAKTRGVMQAVEELRRREDAVRTQTESSVMEEGDLRRAWQALAEEEILISKQWDALQVARQEAKATLALSLEEKLAVEARRSQTDKDSRSANDGLLVAQSRAADLARRREEAEGEEGRLLSKLWEQYDLSHEAARALAQPLENQKEAMGQIGSVKSRIRALGHVNLGAVEEYARVRERYDYLEGHKRDVEDSDRQLVEVISGLGKEMEEIFKREFGRIAKAFEVSFQELFGGGEGALVLEDPKNVLHCGIEIQVRPPGKTMRNLSLLSGGEKAFVAIALYLAILTVRPTPFCVLDEIEAALDDANVSRFAAALRRMSKRTQCIVITHRRGTMEAADLLYGVTMEQQGISRMLRLSLQEAEGSLTNNHQE